MPVYTFVDNKSGIEYDITMSYSDLDEYIKKNPDHQQVFKMNVVDPVGVGVTKPPADFQKYVLGKVKQMPGANPAAIEKRWTIPKEV